MWPLPKIELVTLPPALKAVHFSAFCANRRQHCHFM